MPAFQSQSTARRGSSVIVSRKKMIPPTKSLSAEQKEKLADLLYWALLEIRHLGAFEKAQQASDLADAFHNLPKGMLEDGFSLEAFRDQYLVPYQKKYPGPRPKDFVAAVSEIITKS